MARLTSLRNKFVSTMLLVAGLIGVSTLAIVFYSSTRSSKEHLREVQHHIEAGLKSKGKVLTDNHALALRGLALDNAFLDMQRLVDRAVREDADVAYGLFVDKAGETLAYSRQGATQDGDAVDKRAWQSLGLSESELQAPTSAVARVHRFGEDVFEFAVPVFGEENEQLGTVRYGLSTTHMQEALSEARTVTHASLVRSLKWIGGLVGLATLLGAILSRLQAVRITKPVGELSNAATRLAGGDRTVRVTITSGDELQVLGGSFNKMVEDLDASYGQLEQMNKTLEQKVASRTAQLGAKNRDMRLVLDNVDQGFITISPAGVMATERSKVVDEWFGPCDSPTVFWDYMARVSATFSGQFQLGWEQLTDDFLPTEVCLGQMPTRLNVNGRAWELGYLPFNKEGPLEGLLLVITEITSRLIKERDEAEQSELMQGFKRLMLDRSGFASFLKDASQMVQWIGSRELEQDPVLFKRTVHTLKGNCGVMGLNIVARLCHAIEEQTEEDGVPGDAVLIELTRRWETINQHISAFVGKSEERVIEIPAAELTSLLARMSRSQVDADALRMMKNWQLEPIERPFERLAEQAKTLARNLNKGTIEVDIRTNGIRLEPDTWSPFFSEMVHLVRNSIDHGLETPEERTLAGKLSTPKLTFSAKSSAHSLTLEFSDNGRGINWQRIAERAASLGLPNKTAKDLLDALCHDGVSTREEVSEVSGRGVGMAALRQRVTLMGGTLEVQSKTNEGTTWVIRFPWSPKEVPTARLSRPPAMSVPRPRL